MRVVSEDEDVKVRLIGATDPTPYGPNRKRCVWSFSREIVSGARSIATGNDANTTLDVSPQLCGCWQRGGYSTGACARLLLSALLAITAACVLFGNIMALFCFILPERKFAAGAIPSRSSSADPNRDPTRPGGMMPPGRFRSLLGSAALSHPGRFFPTKRAGTDVKRSLATGKMKGRA